MHVAVNSFVVVASIGVEDCALMLSLGWFCDIDHCVISSLAIISLIVLLIIFCFNVFSMLGCVIVYLPLGVIGLICDR